MPFKLQRRPDREIAAGQLYFWRNLDGRRLYSGSPDDNVSTNFFFFACQDVIPGNFHDNSILEQMNSSPEHCKLCPVPEFVANHRKNLGLAVDDNYHPLPVEQVHEFRNFCRKLCSERAASCYYDAGLCFF